MKIPHFFKAKSRIGLKNKPIHQTELNLGVEDGPDAILTPKFLKDFKQFQISEYIFPKPEDILNEDFDIVLGKHLEGFKDKINLEILRGVYTECNECAQNDNKNIDPRFREDDRERGMDDKAIQVVIGGDHSVTFSSLLATLERTDDTQNLGYIQFDSHADMNLAEDSPTQNFHGMYLRPFLDSFDIPEVAKLIKKKLRPKNMLFIGNLDLDLKERKFFKGKRIKNIDRDKLKTQMSKVKNDFKKFINQFKYLHISFDIDGMDKKIAPATGIPAENGLFREDVFPFLEIISKHPSFSFDICEVNPRKKGAKGTTKLAQDILTIVLKSHSQPNLRI